MMLAMVTNSPVVTPLTNAEKKRFRSIGHQLNPIVTVAEKGLAENVSAEINRALNDHELIKIKLAVGDREHKDVIITEIQDTFSASVVQSIGHVVLLYRKARKQNPKLSNIVRYKP